MGKLVDITGLNRYHENLKTNVLSTKQDNISDLETIRSGAAAGATAEAAAKTYADGLVKDGDGNVKFDAVGSAAAAQAAAEATAAADATSKADAAQAAAEATAAADATSKANAAETAAKTYADELVKDAEGNVKFDAVGSAAAAQAAAEATASADATSKANAAQAAAEATAAADATSKANAAQAAAEKKATDLNTAMDERVVKLEAIDHEKLALDASATAVAAIVAGAESDFDTLKEVADWIASDTQGSAALQTTVSGHTQSINTINGDIDALEENKQDVISDLETIRNGAAAGATALQADDLEYATDDDIDGLFA